jgi:DNA (cytosine-5)-methyltransferase 1
MNSISPSTLIDTDGPRVAEFFAGIGLVRIALERVGCRVVFANDIATNKHAIYAANLDDSAFVLDDIRNVRGSQVPDIDIATASFPCTDLSLAGNRAGLTSGEESSILAEFLRVLDEMRERRPAVAVLENVVGFASSNHGQDLRATIERFNELGYVCDLLILDARHFVPQSRPRLFVVCTRTDSLVREDRPSDVRPAMLFKFARRFPELRLRFLPLPGLPVSPEQTLDEVLEQFDPMNAEWWGVERLGAFMASLSPINIKRLESLRLRHAIKHATAYRRTRNGEAVWEIRADDISGCLRTARGGSSRQAVVEAGAGNVRVRWMTAREYAGLQGVPLLNFGNATESQSKFALGDAVCVPVVEWLARHYLVPAARFARAEVRVEGIALHA